MPFKHHATNLHISEDGRSLLADLLDKKGHKHHRSLDLNKSFSNDNGSFRYSYGYGNFADSARNVHLRGAVLVAELKNREGRWQRAETNLDECVSIERGDLVFDPPRETQDDPNQYPAWGCPS